jgi:hypothetical protein
MANGELCKHCGWQESDHLEINLHRCDANHSRLPGFRRSLIGCGGFVSSVKKKKMTKKDHEAEAFYLEAMEKQGEFRFAWGNYSSTMRQWYFDKKIREFDREIRSSRLDKNETSARARKEAYLEECRSSNGIWIG